MTNMYLNDIDRRRSRTGCIALIVLAVLLLGLLVFWLTRRSSDRVPTDDLAPPTVEAAAAKRSDDKPAEAVVPAGDRGQEWLVDAQAAREQNDYLAARELGWRVLEESEDTLAKKDAEELLNEVNIALVMTRRPMPEKVEHTIQSGDTLGVLARRHNTTIDLIRKSNNLRGDIIRVGDRLRILDATFSIKVSKSRNDLILYMNDRFFKRYPVGTGEFATTPEGRFIIEERIPRPVWWKDGRQIPYGDPDNLLGTHYLKLDVPGYGLHGTWEPESIGYQSSAGCVRLLNEDIEELYILLPTGVEVTIID